MTTKISLWLGAFILIGLGVDFILNDGVGTLFLVRKLADLIEWMAFWR